MENFTVAAPFVIIGLSGLFGILWGVVLVFKKLGIIKSVQKSNLVAASKSDVAFKIVIIIFCLPLIFGALFALNGFGNSSDFGGFILFAVPVIFLIVIAFVPKK